MRNFIHFSRHRPGQSVERPSPYGCLFPGVDADEVFPRLYIGNAASATSPAFLADRGVTHVLNAAEGSAIGFVDVHEDYYRSLGISFHGLRLPDLPSANIGRHFEAVAEFIDSALTGGGTVLVNCLMGMSRSTTAVLAFLCLRRDRTVVEALTLVGY